jgi:hypothetical protein
METKDSIPSGIEVRSAFADNSEQTGTRFSPDTSDGERAHGDGRRARVRSRGDHHVRERVSGLRPPAPLHARAGRAGRRHGDLLRGHAPLQHQLHGVDGRLDLQRHPRPDVSHAPARQPARVPAPAPRPARRGRPSAGQGPGLARLHGELHAAPLSAHHRAAHAAGRHGRAHGLARRRRRPSPHRDQHAAERGRPASIPVDHPQCAVDGRRGSGPCRSPSSSTT